MVDGIRVQYIRKSGEEHAYLFPKKYTFTINSKQASLVKVGNVVYVQARTGATKKIPSVITEVLELTDEEFKKNRPLIATITNKHIVDYLATAKRTLKG